MESSPPSGLVRRQLGLITLRQCRDAGLTRAFVRHRLRSGRWVTVLPGVFSTFTGRLEPRQRVLAATLFAGAGAAATGASACRLYGFRYVPSEPCIDVLVSDGPGVRRHGHADVRICRSVRDWHPIYVEGVPVTPVALSVVEACRRMTSLRDVRALMAEAVQRGRTSTPALGRELARAPSAGTRLPKLAFDDLEAGCRSAPEAELRDLVRTSSVLPEPEWNARLVVPGYGGVIADALWRAARLVGEVNSVAHHTGLEDWERTTARQAALEAAGFAVVPVTPGQLRRQPGPSLLRFEQAYLRRLAELS